MTNTPERIWAWSFNNWGQWGGFARPENRHPLDEKEMATGAEYIRADLLADEIKAHVETQAALREFIADLDKANARVAELIEAMEWYGEPATYETVWVDRGCGCCSDDHIPVMEDQGDRARAALGEKPE